MPKHSITTIILFSGLWGLSEATLGDALYSNDVPLASVPLTIIGMASLAAARTCVPSAGVCTAVAALAMMYKFFNEPFFACHLLGILLTGMCFDAALTAAGPRSKPAAAAAAVYTSYALFALMITYVFRYEYWQHQGPAGIARHVCLAGTLAAAGSAAAVSTVEHIGRRAGAVFSAARHARRFAWGGMSLAAAALWAFAAAALLLKP
jgi:hypothetical protein